MPRRSTVLLAGLLILAASATPERSLPLDPAADRYTLGEFLPAPETVQATPDPAEAMRRLVEQVAAAARTGSPEFLIVAEGGVELVGTAAADGSKRTAGEYLGALDGLLVDGLLFATGRPDQPIAPHQRDARVTLARAAATAGVAVFAVEPVRGDQVRVARDLATAAGLKALVAPPFRPGGAPPRPQGETAGPIASLGEVETLLRIADDAEPQQILASVTAGNADLVIVPPIYRRQPLTADQVKRMQFKRTGARRLVLARIDASGAAPDRWYWRDGWREGAPAWIGAADPAEPDRHHVNYWDPAWLAILAGPERSYLSGLIRLGYDGVVLAGLDDYRRLIGEAP